MLIGIFKSNNKLINLLIVLLVATLWLPLFWSDTSIISSDGSLFNVISGVKDFPILNFTLSVILIGVQGIYLNFIVNQFKLVKNNTHLVALFFVVLNGLSATFLVFNQLIIANIFVLFTLHQLLALYDVKNLHSLSFNIGLVIGVGSLFYAPLVVLFPLLWFVLIYTGTPQWRVFVISIFGLIVPFIFHTSYYFLIGEISIAAAILSINQGVFTEVISIQQIPIYIYVVVVLGFLSGIKLLATLGKSGVKVKKMKVSILVMILLFILTLFFKGKDIIAVLVFIAAPVSVFMADYFNEIKRVWFAELLFLLLIGAIVWSYFS